MNKIRRTTLYALMEQLEVIKEALENVQMEEEEYRDNIPENLQGSARYQHADEICDRLSDAVSSLEDVLRNMDDASSQ